MFISLSASVVGAAFLLNVTVQDVPLRGQTELPRPRLTDDPLPLPPQVILPGRQVFSSDGAPLGVVERVGSAGSGGQLIRVALPNGTVKTVATDKWTVSDGGVVINVTKLAFDETVPAEIRATDRPG